jgi:hypothetical protein
VNVAAQYGITSLLEMTGARIRGRNRADCPDCKRPRAVSFNETAFCCHGIDCDFHGGIGTLRKRLGICPQWLPKREHIRQCRERERVHHAAERLCAAVKARRTELLQALHTLSRIEVGALRAGPEKPSVWDALAVVYRERPGTLAELAFLENANARGLVRFLAAAPEQRQAVVEAILLQGGMYDYAGKFVEVCP